MFVPTDSNLSVFSKLLERLVLGGVMSHLNRHNLLPEHQSAEHHSTETAVLRVSSDLLNAALAGQMSLIVLLDLSAAFETAVHDILLGRLETSFGFIGCALAWFRSYLADRSFSVGYGELASSSTSITCGVLQGSVLGPLLFTMYTAELESVIRAHGLQCHIYADDMQVYGYYSQTKLNAFLSGFRTVLTPSMTGCSSVDSNWTPAKLRWCGALFQIGRHLLRPDPASTICPQPWDLARLRLFHDHSRQQNKSFLHISGKFVASLLHSHLMCGSFSLHLLSYQRLITAIQLWSVYLPNASSNLSVSSTQLLKS